jgi:hypothetical protein
LASALQQASMLKGVEQEERRAICRGCACRLQESLRQKRLSQKGAVTHACAQGTRALRAGNRSTLCNEVQGTLARRAAPRGERALCCVQQKRQGGKREDENGSFRLLAMARDGQMR